MNKTRRTFINGLIFAVAIYAAGFAGVLLAQTTPPMPPPETPAPMPTITIVTPVPPTWDRLWIPAISK